MKTDKRGNPTLFCLACRTRVFFGDGRAFCGFLVAAQRAVDAARGGIDTGSMREQYYMHLRDRGLLPL